MSTFLAILMTPFRPAASARSLGHVSLRRAYLHHIAASLVAVASVVILAGAYDSLLTLDFAVEQLLMLLIHAVAELNDRPTTFLFRVGMTSLAIEVVFVALGIVFSSWGARNEPVKDSIRNSLRFVWLNTWQLAFAITLAGSLLVTIHRLHVGYQSRNPIPVPNFEIPQPPTLPSTDPGYPAAFQEYRLEHERWLREWRQLNRDWEQAAPFYVGYADSLCVAGCCAAGLWALWCVLASIGARPRTDIEILPPRCDTCGYDLSVTPIDSNCPECGFRVVDSIGPTVRPGAPWRRCNPINGFSWPRCTWNAIRKPEKFGTQLRLYPHRNDHRMLLAITLFPAFIFGFLGVITSFVLAQHQNPFQHEPEVVFSLGPAAGCLCVAGTTVLACLAATTVGLFLGGSVRRNLLPGAIQVACYQSGYTILWILFGGLWFGAILHLEREKVFETLASQSRLSWHAMMFWGYVLPNVLGFLMYFVLVYRGTRAMRFANR